MKDLKLDVSKTAVLAMDFQERIVSMNAMAKERGVIQKAKAVLDNARRAGLPIIHIVIQFREGYPEVSYRNRMFSGVKQMGLFVIGQEETKIHKDLAPV